jgi:uncharacterized protein
MNTNLLAPREELAERQFSVLTDSEDGAHDSFHIQRVWLDAKAIQVEDGDDLEVSAAAAILHDCIEIPKDSLDG